MESKNKLLNYFMELNGVPPISYARAAFMEDYIAQHGTTIDPLIADIIGKTGKDDSPTSYKSAVLTTAHLIIDIIGQRPDTPWIELCAQLSQAAAGPKYDILMGPLLKFVEEKTQALNAAGLSILTLVPASAEPLATFEALFSNRLDMIREMLIYNLADHFRAYTPLIEGQMDLAAKGYRRYPSHLQALIKPILYNQTLSVDASEIRTMVFGSAELGAEERYTRVVNNARRVWQGSGLASGCKLVDMPPLSPAFMTRYGQSIAQEIFNIVSAGLRYGIGADGIHSLRQVINHLSNQGLDWLSTFALSTQNGCNMAAMDDDLGEVDREQALKLFLSAFAFRNSADHEASRHFCNLVMDTLPKELVATGLDTDKIRKRRYYHCKDPFYLNLMEEDSAVEGVLQEDLGL
ncbi:hypothetical protein RBE51_21400 [Pseudomonas taiwanensis]|uniref:hypothetical protein n=1 Tax=Pseudomonas taiwanensis TaxID=470150 RepID=UPI0028DFD6F1|nr:hypothetical protein [Pseudomonas taiwanensis]MDT8925355.1 hypothetical protein [Pseudomonas taiwanensis]